MALVRFAAYLSASPDPTDGADLVSGSAWATSYAVVLESHTAPVGNTDDQIAPVLTGLSAGQSYKVAAVYDDNGTYQSLVVSGAISTLSAFGIATETDAAQPLVRVKTKAIGQALETETAQALGKAKSRALGIATETDTALPITLPGEINQPITPALEAETAIALGKAKRKAIGTATETDAAIALTFSSAKVISTATETDTALALGKAKRKAINPALETDAALALSRTVLTGIAPALESDTAISFGKAKRKAIGTATETETAVRLTLFRVTTLNEADLDAIADRVYSKLVGEGLVLRLLELWQLQGLDIANPMTVTPTARQVDAITLALTGDGETSTTVTRQ